MRENEDIIKETQGKTEADRKSEKTERDRSVERESKRETYKWDLEWLKKKKWERLTLKDRLGESNTQRETKE